MNVLIADDHLLFREGLRRLVSQIGNDLTISEAGTFDEVRSLCDGADAVELILLDLNLPGWSGFADISDLHRSSPGAMVVVVSASQRPEDVAAALEHGAAGFIPKSSSVKVLLGALNLVLAGGVYLPASAVLGDFATAGPGLGERDGEGMTKRQREVLARLREGKSNKEIAWELGLTEGTVKVHVTAILRVLGVRNRTQAALFPPSP